MITDWNTYYTGTQEAVTAANSQIDLNCGLPDADAQTWYTPTQAYQQDFWFILMPPPEGYKNSVGAWTQSQMINGVTNVTEQQSQTNWWPPSPFPPGGN